MPNWCANYLTFVDDDNFTEFLTDIKLTPGESKVTHIGILLGFKGVPESAYSHINGRCLELDIGAHYPVDDASYAMQFQSAWDYPAEAMELLIRTYGLSVTALSEEPGHGIYSKIVYVSGEEVESTDYNPIINKHAKKYVLRYLKDMRRATAEVLNRKHGSILSSLLARLIKNYRKSHYLVSHHDIEDGTIISAALPMRKYAALPDIVKETLAQLEDLVSTRHSKGDVMPDFVDWENLT